MISVAAWQGRGKYYKHSAQPVFYMDTGSGDALLLIHGFPTASWDWSMLWPDLTARFRCIAPDMMGFGFSAKPFDYPYSIMDQADLHEGLLAALGVDRVHILAHDYGDTVAQELLARFNERQQSGQAGVLLQSLCLLNGGLFPETHHARFVQKLLNSPLGPVLSRLMNQRSFSKSFSAVFGANTQPSPDELESFWQLVNREGGTRIAYKLIKYINERRAHRDRWVGALQTADIPVRLINGPDDPVSGQHMVDRYCELIKNPDVVTLEGIGHYPQVESPAAVLEAFLHFQADRPAERPDTNNKG